MNDFSIHDFLLNTVIGLVGKRPDFNVREMAAGWYDKGVFSVADVAGIEAEIQAQYPVAVSDGNSPDSVSEADSAE